MKNILNKPGILFISVIFLLFFNFFIGCDSNVFLHEHTFCSDWSRNEEYHWHSATCEHFNEVSEKDLHLFDEWENGKRSCFVCGYEQECNHNYNSGEVTTKPACTFKGVKTYTCNTCGQTKKEDINATGHIFSSLWSRNSLNHWHEAICDHADEVSEKAEHLFDEWEKGKRSCFVCGYEQECNHNYNSGEVTTKPTCTVKGIKKYTCNTCGQTKKESINATGHSFDSAWSSDSINHWHDAICSDTSEIRENAEHIFGEWNKGKQSCTVCSYIQTCEHNYNSGEVTKTPACTVKGVKIYTCTICGQTKKEDIEATGHSFDSAWSRDSTKHWHVATCGDTNEIRENAEHIFCEWENGKRSCTVCGYVQNCEHNLNSGVVTTDPACTVKGERTYSCPCKMVVTTEDIPATGHSIDNGTATKIPGCFTKGLKTFKCKTCEEILSTEEIDALGWCESVIDAVTFGPASSSSIYVYFGVFPQTVLPSDSTVTVSSSSSVKIGNSVYFEGSDGEYYAKVLENAYTDFYTYSDGSTAKQSNVSSTRYFKVEPIKWKVLTTDYNSTETSLLLAENILISNIGFYQSESSSYLRTIGEKTVKGCNYRYSTIRGYLNGSYESDDTQKTTYKEKGFLQNAFTVTAQNLIKTTTVINNGLSTTDAGQNFPRADGYNGTGTKETGYSDNTCEDTEDKIFLISEQEVTTLSYGFETDNSRIRITTDYAKANYAFQDTAVGSGGFWWLRSPSYGDRNSVLFVGHNGSADYWKREVDYKYYGIVPAITVEF